MPKLLNSKSESPVAVPCWLCSAVKAVRKQKCPRFLHQNEQMEKISEQTKNPTKHKMFHFPFGHLKQRQRKWPGWGEEERGFPLPSAQKPHCWTFGCAEGDLLSQTHCLPDWKQGFSTSSPFYSRLCAQLWGSVFSNVSFPFSPDEALCLQRLIKYLLN